MWQWNWLHKLSDQITKYSTFFGQLWYVIVFIFRLIVVIGLGSAVYGDEQGNFRCSQDIVGCTQACYNQFTKISHLRFWGFQLLAVITPVIVFHFLATYFTGQILKIKETEEKLRNNGNNDNFKDDRHRAYEISKMQNRQKIVGKVRTRKIHSDGDLKEIPVTDKIRLAYYICIVLRLSAEGIFLYFTYTLYNYPDVKCNYDYFDFNCYEEYFNNLHFLWATFPVIYRCKADLESLVFIACRSHFVGSSLTPLEGGSVPCWTSRPYEKTIFLRYMNILSAICFVLCCLELIYIPIKFVITQARKRSMHGPTNLELDDYYGRSRSSSRSERGETSFGLRSPNPVNFEHQHTLTYPTKKLPYYHEHERHLSSPTLERTFRRHDKQHPEYTV